MSTAIDTPVFASFSLLSCHLGNPSFKLFWKKDNDERPNGMTIALLFYVLSKETFCSYSVDGD